MKKILIAIGVLVAIVVVLGLVAPTDFKVEREIVVEKPKDLVFAQLKFVKNHNAWSPWAKLDPNMEYDYRGEDGTVGFVSAWKGNKDVGVGEQEIKNIVEGERIETEIRFKEPMESTNSAYLATEAVSEGQTKVKWGMAGKNPFPFNIVCMVMNMQKMIEKDFDEGLGNLKAILEKQ